ncbi:MAG TPA: inositol monophosphatase family protein [Pseudonocardia sp.]|jgi:fructose-1,6-bisphosphatase/inositol monophosphatase family enzyme|uniref:inositol monophosphatase family protein n=1 Tax=Pseudonocardia sp. TaxID=60912 RepID=UPI002B4B2116|nr:inositol monophosphatase family protein [Pseudonocardia sp.]HLU54098.1 inositol monophosphatase family protein [Pseudonocardia sp.]
MSSTVDSTLQPEELAEAARVAEDAARLAIRIVRSAPLGTVEEKVHAADLVTDVDRAVEREVRELVARRLPGHTLVGEEFGGAAADGPTWYCDPVDGTTNLVAGLPWTSFSLALAVGTSPLVGVVADPWREEVVLAVAGKGVTVNGRPVPRTRPPHRSRLTGGVVLTEWAAHRPWPGMAPLLAALADRACTVRVMGSGTLALGHVAAGRATGAVISEFHPEDHLAAAFACAEAGLAVRDESGAQTPFPERGGILVCAPEAADELFDVWREAVSAARDPGAGS